MENCYNIGNVYGKYPGGITGCTNGPVQIKNCYYLETTAEYEKGYDKGSSGKITSEQMQDIEFVKVLNENIEDNLNNWIVDTDNLNSGYPIFITQGGYLLYDIHIVTPSSKTNYIEGQNFDNTGMVIEATYSNGSKANISGYTITDGANLSKGKTNVTISYTEGEVTKTTTQNITVAAKILSSITVKTAPRKTNYIEGQNFDSTGMIIEATYSDESKANISGYTITDGANLSKEKTNVTISYTEGEVTKTTIQNITVAAKTLQSIEVITMPAKTTYIKNYDQLNLAGGRIKLIYNDMTTEEKEMVAGGIEVTGFNNTVIGTNTITVAYGGKNTTFMVSIVKGTDKVIVSDKYRMDGEYIFVPSKTTAEEFLSNIEIQNDVVILNKDNNQVASDGKLMTGMKIKIDDEITYKIVVIGDINGDGDVNSVDLLAIKRHILSANKPEWILTGIQFMAGNINGDAKIDVVDMLGMKRLVLQF